MKKKLLLIPTLLLAASMTACNLSFIDKYLGVEDEEDDTSESRPDNGTSSDTSSSYSSLGDVLVSSIRLDRTEIELNEGTNTQLEATILPKNATNQVLEWTSDNDAIATVDSSGVVTAVNHGETIIRVRSTDGGNRTANCSVTVIYDGEEAIIKATKKYNYYDLDNSGNVAPTGDQKVLVIPTYFPDDSINATEANRQFIEKSFFGTNEECGWRSFTGYYEQASFNQLHYSGYVSPVWYEAEYNRDYVRDTNDSSKTIASHALKWFKEQNPSFDWTGYDANNDGILDSLYIIYASDYDPNTNLWGYRWSTTVSSGPGISAYPFSWFSLQFLTNTSDYGGVPATGSNTRIIIHEHGHMLGLADYYDNAYSGMDLIGGWDMQDRNVLDWNSFSKYAVGWTQPYYVVENKLQEKTSEVITLTPASESGDCLLLRDSTWNGSPFDEYILLELFNPNIGNNAYDSAHNTQAGMSQIGYGVRMFHVDARMAHYWFDGGIKSGPTDTIDDYTFIPNDNDLKSYEGHNSIGRQVGFTEWENYHLLHMIQKENLNTFETTDSSIRHTWRESDLFQTGDSFCIGNHSGYTNYGPEFFYNTTTFNDGTTFPYGIEFLNVTGNNATIRVTYLD